MIALDTNVLVRFLVEDSRAQSERATRFVKRAVQRDETLFVSEVVLCEVVWVLDASYKVSRQEIARTLASLLQARHLAFRDADALARALAAFSAGKGDFADYVIREQARSAGCETVATFDRALLREPGFVSP